MNIISKVLLHVIGHRAKTQGQLLGLDGVKLSLVPLQALQLMGNTNMAAFSQLFIAIKIWVKSVETAQKALCTWPVSSKIQV